MWDLQQRLQRELCPGSLVPSLCSARGDWEGHTLQKGTGRVLRLLQMSHTRRNYRRVGHGGTQRGLLMCRTRAGMDSVCFAFVWTQGLDSGVGFDDPCGSLPTWIFRDSMSKCGKALSLPGSVHVVVLPFDADPHGLVDPLLLGGQGVDLVGLPEVGAAGGRHVLGELRGRAVRGVEQGLVVAHHRQSLLGRDRTSPQSCG